MTTIEIHRSKTGATIQQHIVFVDQDPHPNSLASLVLLNYDFRIQDVDFLKQEDDLAFWLEFREIYLLEQLNLHGDLVCTYCGKKHLEIGGKTNVDLILNNKNPRLATIDHIVALANGGEKYNKKNLCVACKRCNGKKGTKHVETFKNKVVL